MTRPMAKAMSADRQPQASMSQVKKGTSTAPEKVTPNCEMPMAVPRRLENQLAMRAALGMAPARAKPVEAMTTKPR